MIFEKKLFYSLSRLALAHKLYHILLGKKSVYSLLHLPKLTGRNMSANNFKYESGTSSVVFVTAPDEKIAKKLAEGLIEQRLAACVNIIPNIESVYMWEGKLNHDKEYLMVIKTRTSRFEDLSKWVRDNHPYSVAEVLSMPIEHGNVPYMKWLSDSVSEKTEQN